MRSDPQKQRSRKLAATLAGLVILGLGYALFVRLSGFAIPCIFNRVTGLLCPGCGVTRMCMNLLSGDLTAAWSSNPAIMGMLPLTVAVGCDVGCRYVASGTLQPHKWANVLVWIMICTLLVFGIVRNIV